MGNGHTKVVLAAVDGSEGSTAALKKAAAAARTDGAELVVVAVAPRRLISGPVLDELREYARVEHLAGGAREAESLAAEDILAEAKQTVEDTCRDVDPVYLSRAGNPADEILACAEEHAAAALYLGSRGLGTLGSLFLGSVSKEVAHAAPCPVVIVPKDE